MMSLDYVSIDLCVDSTQEYWLLDINPFGRYLWLEYQLVAGFARWVNLSGSLYLLELSSTQAKVTQAF